MWKPICRALPLAVFAFAAYWAARLAWADFLFQTGTPDNIRRAADLVPTHARYQARAGRLDRAVALNPDLWEAWLELAFQAESRDDFPETERCLLEANRAAQLFAPRWAAANFYLRRGRASDFWKWSRAAAERSYPDRSALFRLNWKASEKSDEILDRAIPPDRSVLTDYVHFLTSEGRLEAALKAAVRALPLAGATDSPPFLSLCEKLLETKRTADARSLWNGMIGKGWLPYAKLERGNQITNPSLAAPIGKGFDWRLAWRTGVDARWLRSRELMVALNGRQEQRVELLWQYLPPIEPGRYRLRFRYRTNGMTAATGMRWEIGGVRGPELAPSEESESVTSFDLSKPPGRIALVYERLPGSVRTEGEIRILAGIELAP